MGTDLFTSSRGPGVIGTFMAVFVLLGFGVLYILVFDKSLQGGEKTIESVIAADAKDLAGRKSQILSASKRIEAIKGYREIQGELEEEQVREKLLVERREDLTKAVKVEEQSILTANGSWEFYKQEYRNSERAAAAGEKMDELKTLSGETYTKVKVTDVDAVRMQIRHSAGIKGIPFEELPLDLQDRFQFDKEEKEKRVSAEINIRKKGHIGSSIGDLKITIADLKHQNVAAEKKVKKLEQAFANARAAGPDLKNQLISKNRELEADQQKRSDRTANGRQGISRAPQIREEIAHIEGRISLAARLVPQLSRDIDEEERLIQSREQQVNTLQAKLDVLNQKLKAPKKP